MTTGHYAIMPDATLNFGGSMLDEKKLEELEQTLQRIFGLKIGRTTFREAQNAILSIVNGNKDDATALFEMFLSGEIKDNRLVKHSPNQMRTLINSYGVPLRLARDVYERGDFLQVITSDTIFQNERPMFVNRIKRVDGKEHQFICDVQSTLHLINHFLSRLQELETSNPKVRHLTSFSKELESIQEKLKAIKATAKAG